MHHENSDNKGNGLLSDIQNPANQPEVEISSSGTDTYDMFADDDEHAVPSSNENLAADVNGVNLQSPNKLNPNSESMPSHPMQIINNKVPLNYVNFYFLD